MASHSIITAAAALLALLALAQLSAAQLDPVPLATNDPNYVKVDIELLKKVKGGNTDLKGKYVAYYFLDFGCASDPDKYMQSKMGHLYAWRSHSEAGVLDTVGDLMREAQNQLKYAKPTEMACKEAKQKQEEAYKAAEQRKKQADTNVINDAVALAMGRKHLR